MAVLEEGNTLYGAGLSHWKGQTGVNHAIEARDRLINSELIGRLLLARTSRTRSLPFCTRFTNFSR